MSRNCHFGSGKLILSTPDHVQMNATLDQLVVRKKKLNVTVSVPHPRKTQHHSVSMPSGGKNQTLLG